MTLFDGPSRGVVTAVGGDDSVHRRLVDLGLLDARYTKTASRKNAVLVDYGEFSAVSDAEISGVIFVEPVHSAKL